MKLSAFASIIRISDTAHARLDAAAMQKFRVGPARVFGGFKRSSQHRLCSLTTATRQRLRRRFPAQGFSWSGIEGRGHGGDLVGAVDAQVGAFGKY